MGNPALPPTPEKPTTVAADPESRCFVQGEPVKSLYALITGGPAFLISEDMGTHEFSRVYYIGGKFGCGSGEDRIGGIKLLSASYEPYGGLTLKTLRGTVFVPPGRVQATWTLA